MKNKKNSIIILLSVLVLGLSGYLLYDSITSGEMNEARIQTEFNDLKADYEFMQKDIESNMVALGTANKVIELQRKKIEVLMKKSSITEEELNEAKKLMKEISQGVLDEFKKRVANLEMDKNQLNIVREEDEQQLKELEAQIKKLEVTNQSINKKYGTVSKQYTAVKKESEQKDDLLRYASRLTLSNFVLKAFKIRNNGKEVETDKASKIDRVKLDFDITKNKIAESGEKEIYFVVYHPNGSLLTFKNKPSGSFNFNGVTKTYSDKVTVNYVKGEEQKVQMVWDSDDFERGDYVVEMYEKNGNDVIEVGKTTKTLE